MTMHLEGPWLSTTGKKRSKQKWASAEQKRKAQVLSDSWKKKIAEIDKLSSTKYSRESKVVNKSSDRATLDLKIKTPPGRETVYIASQDTGWVACTRKTDQEYTGTAIVGISTLHKSNGIPVFSQQEAEEVAKMRR